MKQKELPLGHTDCYGMSNDQVVINPSDQRYLIWDEETGEWWSAPGQGTTYDASCAYHYRKVEAISLLKEHGWSDSAIKDALQPVTNTENTEMEEI